MHPLSQKASTLDAKALEAKMTRDEIKDYIGRQWRIKAKMFGIGWMNYVIEYCRLSDSRLAEVCTNDDYGSYHVTFDIEAIKNHGCEEDEIDALIEHEMIHILEGPWFEFAAAALKLCNSDQSRELILEMKKSACERSLLSIERAFRGIRESVEQREFPDHLG